MNLMPMFQGEEKETLAYKVLPADQTKSLSEIDDVDLLQKYVLKEKQYKIIEKSVTKANTKLINFP